MLKQQVPWVVLDTGERPVAFWIEEVDLFRNGYELGGEPQDSWV